jgi:phytol kinase
MIQGVGATLVLVVGLLGAMAIMSRLVAAGAVHPEVSRKTLHVCMGVSCLALPWAFPDPLWFAIGFSIVLATLAAVRYVPAVNRHLTGALHAVERSSGGDVYFAASVAILYAVARDEPVLYVTPLLVLTLADALAALAGVFYAKTAYESYHARKSWEGSIVFFVVAFLCIHVTTLILTDLGRIEGLTVSLTLAYVATLIEGASWEGLDNLFLPIAMYLLLDGFLRMNAAEVADNVGLTSAIVLVGLTALAWIVSRLTHVPADATMAMVAFAFIFWTVTEFALIIPGLIVGAISVAALMVWGTADLRTIRGRTVAAACAPLTVLIVAMTQGATVPLVTAGHAAFAAILGFMLPSLRYRRTGRTPSIFVGAALGLASGALLLSLWLLVQGQSDKAATVSAAVEIARSGLIAGLIGGTAWSAQLSENWWLATLLALVSLAVAGPVLFQAGAIP